MRQVGHEFTTSLSVDQCKRVFQDASKRSRGLSAKMGGVAAKMGGNDQGGFFTPEFAKSFDFGADGRPALSIGVWIERISAGAKGAGYSVQMHVWDLGNSRKVNLFAPHGITAVHKPRQLIRKFTQTFHEADPKIPLAGH